MRLCRAQAGRMWGTVSVGRRPLIALTYILSGVLLLIAAGLFVADLPIAATQAPAWSAAFFVASAAASSGYLTVGEIS